VIVNFVLQRAVPNFVQTVRVRFVAPGGNVVQGPLTQPKTAQLTFTGVPTSSATIEMDYLIGTTIIGFFRGNLPWNGTAGPIIINDPDFVDVNTLTALTLDPPSPRTPLGQTIQFAASGRFSDGESYDLTRSVTWTSSNTTAAVIGPGTGLLETRAVGLTNVTAALNNVTGTAEVNVTNATITGLRLEPANASLSVLQTRQFQALATFSDASTRDVTGFAQWRTGNRATADITEEGTLTAVAAGNTTAEASLGTLRAHANVTVAGPNLTGLDVTPANFTLLRLSFQQLIATARFADGSARDVTTNVTWTSSVPSGAAVNSATGLVRGLFPGLAVIRAQLGLLPEAFANVTVLDQFGPGASPEPFPSPSPGASPRGPRRQDYPAAVNPAGIAAADVNGDNRIDLAVSSLGSQADIRGSVGVYLNVGGGSFGSRTTYGAGVEPYYLEAGVMRSGARPDLVVANSGNGKLLSMRNDGSGVFAANQTSPGLGGDPMGLGIADFNLDGFNDVAVVLQDNFEVQILLGAANGTLTLGRHFDTGFLPLTLAVGDFDGRNGPDIAVANTQDNLTVALNNGAGRFTTRQIRPRADASGIVAGDYNGDGRLDLAFADFFNSQVAIMLGDGSGGFTAAGGFDVGSRPLSLAQGDFNGDGRLDLATCSSTDDTASLLLGAGDGSFTPGATLPVGRAPAAIVAADFDGDGRSDIATANADEDTVTVWTGVP